MDKYFRFALVKIINDNKEVYGISVVTEDQVRLLPFAMDSMEQLKSAMQSIVDSFTTREVIAELVVSEDQTEIINMRSIPNPMYQKKEEQSE